MARGLLRRTPVRALAADYLGIGAALRRVDSLSEAEVAALVADLPPASLCDAHDRDACGECGAAGVQVPATRSAPAPDLAVEWSPSKRAAAMVPAHLRRATIESWRPANSEKRRRVEQWVDDLGEVDPLPDDALPFLLLTGTVGTGKSHMAAGIVRRLAETRGIVAVWWSWSELLGERQRMMFDDDYAGPWTATRLHDSLTSARLLVLDDVGAGNPTPAAGGFLQTILDARVERLPTVITSNVFGEALGAKVGAPALSRASSGLEVRFTGPDRRVVGFDE